MVGLGILINSLYVYCVFFLWASMYVAAPFLEEPLLEKQYGNEFLAYKARVPRFVGIVKNET
jgi:protein-S-isoprenylcysteine O-methyltransferase Ste14